MKKVCKQCKIEKSLLEFHKHKQCKYGVKNTCKPCTNLINKEYVSRPEVKIHRANKQKEYRNSNPERHRKYVNNWRKKNLHVDAEYQARRRQRKKKALLYSNQKKDILTFYKNCPPGHHVDHIIPLKGKNVSGLHCLENLQYLSIIENLKKYNKF